MHVARKTADILAAYSALLILTELLLVWLTATVLSRKSMLSRVSVHCVMFRLCHAHLLRAFTEPIETELIFFTFRKGFAVADKSDRLLRCHT